MGIQSLPTSGPVGCADQIAPQTRRVSCVVWVAYGVAAVIGTLRLPHGMSGSAVTVRVDVFPAVTLEGLMEKAM